MSARLDDNDALSLIQALDALDGEIETLQSSKRDLLADARRSLDLPGARIAHCRERVGPAPLRRRDRPAFSRGVVISTKILGVEFDDAKILLTQDVDLPAFQRAKLRMAQGCPVSAVGFVYIVESPLYPGIYKIGFTTDLARRGNELVREYKVPLRYIHASIGTYADEYARQRRVGHLWLTGEWFGRESDPRFCPPFLREARGQPVRELAESFCVSLGMGDVSLPNSGPFRTVSEEEDMPRAEQPAREAQDATPARCAPVAQSEGQPVRARKASVEVPERGVGEGAAGQTEEFVTVSEAGEAIATADDPASGPDDQVSRESASEMDRDDDRLTDLTFGKTIGQTVNVPAENALEAPADAQRFKPIGRAGRVSHAGPGESPGTLPPEREAALAAYIAREKANLPPLDPDHSQFAIRFKVRHGRDPSPADITALREGARA